MFLELPSINSILHCGMKLSLHYLKCLTLTLFILYYSNYSAQKLNVLIDALVLASYDSHIMQVSECVN